MASVPFNNLITFSRGSNATLTGANGLIQYAPNNLLTFSEQFDNAAWTKQGVGVATAPTVTANSGVAPDGTSTADRVQFSLNGGAATGDISQIFQSVTLTSAPAIFSVYLKSNTASSFNMQITNPDGSGTAITVTPEWQRFNGISAVAPGAVNYQIRLRGGQAPANSNTADVLVWGAQVELGSTATTYNPTTVKNLLGFSEAFDNAAWTKTRASIVTGAQANPVNGAFNAQKLMEDTTASNSHAVYRSVTLSAAPQTLSIYAKAAGRNWFYLVCTTAANAGAYFNLATGEIGTVSSGYTAAITSVGNGWYRCSITFTATAATWYPNVYLADANNSSSYTGDGNSGVYIYGAQLSDSASLDPYVPTPGAAPSSTAYYGPRFDYDPATLQPKGILIEEQRVNLATGSADFTATYWPVATNAVVTADNTTSPDGTNNADRLADNTTAGVQHRIYRDYTFTAASHTLSVFAKRNDHRWLRLFFFDGTTSFFGNFDLLNGVVGNKQASTTTTITAFGNGWYRCTMTATTAAAAGNIQLVMLPTDDTAVPVLYTGTGTSLWLFGAQLEAGAFATSYIPTIASQVTRTADVAAITGTNFSSWYNQTEGTFVLGGSIFANQGATTVDFLQASNGVSNAIAIDLGMFDLSAPFFGVSNTTSQANLDLGTLTLNSPFKMVGAYKVNDFAGTINGGTVQTDTSGTVPSGIVQLGIGNRLSGPYMNGHIRSINYFPTRLADFQLQALTELSLVATLNLNFISGMYDA